MVKQLSILGATGSIGKNTLDIVAQHPDAFSLVAVTAHQNLDGLLAICKQFNPRYAAIAAPELQQGLREALAGSTTEAIGGENAVCDAASIACDVSVAALMGAVGVAPILRAFAAGCHVALANKEALVCAGPQVLAAAAKAQKQLLPLDSEHNAAFQCWNAHTEKALEKLTLTASGGPFRTRALDSFASITPEEAVKHPRWNMGAKISVDSATMMNKGLELIEAHYLFGLPAEKLDAVLHPQSIVHALLSHHDGSVLAQMGAPDMRIPIAYALGLPEGRLALNVPKLDLAQLGALEFAALEEARYPLFFLAKQAMQHGQAAMISLNAANEVAVAAFLAGRLSFPGIYSSVAQAVEKMHDCAIATTEDTLMWDAQVRAFTTQLLTS